MSSYSLKQVYEALNGDQNNVTWDKVVWNRISVPKHRFIAWMVVH